MASKHKAGPLVDIPAHFTWVSSAVETVELTLGDHVLSGQFKELSDFGALQLNIDMTRLDKVPDRVVGHPVWVCYRDGDALYAFESQVLLMEQLDQWWLKVPGTVYSSSKRLLERQYIKTASGFRLHLSVNGEDRSFKMVDLSLSGLAFNYDDRHLQLDPSGVYESALETPGGQEVRLQFVVKNTRKAGKKIHDRVAGVYFLKPSKAAQRTIVCALLKDRQSAALAS
jgi:hypothetical protein